MSFIKKIWGGFIFNGIVLSKLNFTILVLNLYADRGSGDIVR